MARDKHPPKNTTYYEALGKVFNLQSEFLTAALPHAGERGSNDEGRCRAFLRQVLPQRYAVGTGFVVSSEVEAPSPQQDIVIYDDLNNSPLHRELVAAVYPVEIVYATVEVKGLLDRASIRSTVEAIGKTRRLGMRCYYLSPPRAPGRQVRTPLAPVKKPPWALVFAYGTTYTRLDRFQRAWEDVSDELRTAHVHGVVVLEKDWYCFQLPNQSPSRFNAFEGNALLRFTNGLLSLLQSAVIVEADMGRYLKIPVAPPDDEVAPNTPSVSEGGGRKS